MAPEVIIDPGHGGTTTYGGSSPAGVQTAAGIDEKHVNLELARRVSARLGSVAQLTRTGDVNVPLRERAELAARSGARVLVSIHANAGAPGIRGSEVWVHERHDAGSAELAREIYGSLERVGPTRGLYQGPLAVLDPAAVGGAAACLIEADYLSDAEGHSRLTSARGLDELADAISTGVRRYLGGGAQQGDGQVVRDYESYDEPSYHAYEGAGQGWQRALGGLPNLSFGTAGPDGRPLGAVSFAATPVPGTPVQIIWTDYNLADTEAGSYTDEVCVFDQHGRLLHREELRISGIPAGGSQANYIAWTPREPGPVTARVRLNAGVFPIPEERTDDNESTASAVVATRIRGAAALQSNISVREVRSAGQLRQRFRGDQNVGFSPYISHLSARHDYNNNFILLVWAQGNACDVDLVIELFDRDPRDAGATVLDSQVRRIALADGQRFGYEYSRLPDTDPIYFRISYTEYSTHQRSGEYLWMNAYG